MHSNLLNFKMLILKYIYLKINVHFVIHNHALFGEAKHITFPH